MKSSSSAIALIIVSICLIFFWVYGLVLTYHLKKYALPGDKNLLISAIYVLGGIFLSLTLVLILFLNFKP